MASGVDHGGSHTRPHLEGPCPPPFVAIAEWATDIDARYSTLRMTLTA
jgi:hypothetical protein